MSPRVVPEDQDAGEEDDRGTVGDLLQEDSAEIVPPRPSRTDASLLALSQNISRLKEEIKDGGISAWVGGYHDEAMKEPPCVAVMTVADGSHPPIGDSHLQVQLPSEIEVLSAMSVSYFREPRNLIVCRLQRDTRTSSSSPVAQLEKLHDLIDGAVCEQHKPRCGPYMWPLHGQKTRTAILMAEEAMMAGAVEGMGAMSKFQRLLYWLRLQAPPKKGPMSSLLADHYGRSVAFSHTWGHFYTQQIWFLCFICVTWICIKAVMDATPMNHDKDVVKRVLWELTKVNIILWGCFVAGRKQQFLQKSQGKAHGTVMSELFKLMGKAEDPSPRSEMSPRQRFNSAITFHNTGSTSNPDFVRIDCKQLLCRWAKLLFVVVPVLAAFILLVNGTLLGVAQLLVYLTFIWGDCVNLGCRSPDVKHGFEGWLAEVAVDVLLAILFELFFACTKGLAEWFASIRNYETLHSNRFAVEMLTLVIAAVERIGTFGIIAFVFVPQWEKPPGDKADLSIDCSDLLLGEGSFFCLQRRLPLKQRRGLFEMSLKGPFCVAPFVGILMKVIVPVVAQKLDLCGRTYECTGLSGNIARGIARILALIFSYDGDHVGCLLYVVRGWPFRKDAPLPLPNSVRPVNINEEPEKESLGEKSETCLEKDRSNPAQAEEHNALVDRALDQAVRKPFEPEGELMEVKLNFLWIIFFAPIKPDGVITMLIARLIEVKTDMSKLLMIRRRTFPKADVLDHHLMGAFLKAAVFGGVGWSIGLSCITYNDDLWKWGYWKVVVTVVVTLWLITAAGFALSYEDRGLTGIIVEVAAFVVLVAAAFLMYDRRH